MKKMDVFHNLCSPEYELVDQKYETSWNESYFACMVVMDLWGFFLQWGSKHVWNPTNILSLVFFFPLFFLSILVTQ